MLFMCTNIRWVVQEAKSDCLATEQKATGTKKKEKKKKENPFVHKKYLLVLFKLLE